MRPIKVLIVDDSVVVRKLLADSMQHDEDLEVVGTAADPYIARDLIVRHEPDVLTLDVEMPGMDGLTFLRRLMRHHPMPVIVVSSVTPGGSAASVEALCAGAVDVVPKPAERQALAQVAATLKQRIRGVGGGAFRFNRAAAATALPERAEPAVWPHASGLIVIGASTGGTQATEALLARLPASCPPMAVVQHMPAHFTRAYAARLNSVCPMRVVEAEDGAPLDRGTVLVAPGGDGHMTLESRGQRQCVRLTPGPPVHHQRPSVDVLFHSAARLRGTPVVGVLLTGMGADGADGLLALRRAGAETIAQDEASCVVFGMPREAIHRGAAGHVVSLAAMPGAIRAAFDRSRVPPGSRDGRAPDIRRSPA
jgi:two-component system chemotaxis response regulator CheB